MKYTCILSIVLLVTLLLLVVACIYLSRQEDTVVIEGIKYRMTPHNVKQILGEPIKTDSHEGNSSDILWCSYNAEVWDHHATINMGFADVGLRKEMFHITIAFESLNGSEDAIKLKSYATDLLVQAYKGETGYRYYEKNDTVTIITNQGAEGITCYISATETSVRVTCIKSF